MKPCIQKSNWKIKVAHSGTKSLIKILTMKEFMAELVKTNKPMVLLIVAAVAISSSTRRIAFRVVIGLRIS